MFKDTENSYEFDAASYFQCLTWETVRDLFATLTIAGMMLVLDAAGWLVIVSILVEVSWPPLGGVVRTYF